MSERVVHVMLIAFCPHERAGARDSQAGARSEEHTSELQSLV